MGEKGIQNRIGDSIADLVRMPFGNGFTREEVLALSHHSLPFRSSFAPGCAAAISYGRFRRDKPAPLARSCIGQYPALAGVLHRLVSCIGWGAVFRTFLSPARRPRQAQSGISGGARHASASSQTSPVSRIKADSRVKASIKRSGLVAPEQDLPRLFLLLAEGR